MKIDRLELFKVPPRWLFLKITTDSGLAGWGEPVVEGRADTVKVAVEEMSDYLLGKDPSHIEDIWQCLYRGGFYRGGPILSSAISGIDQALWDIKGKRLGVPIWQLLGGKVYVYRASSSSSYDYGLTICVMVGGTSARCMDGLGVTSPPMSLARRRRGRSKGSLVSR